MKNARIALKIFLCTLGSIYDYVCEFGNDVTGSFLVLRGHTDRQSHLCLYAFNPKATDRGPFGPRTRLTTDFLCVNYL